MRWPAVLDLVEAAARSGHLEHAQGVMAELEAIAARSGPPLLLILLACARPLLADEEDAQPCSRSRSLRIARRTCIRARERCSRSAVGCVGSGAASSRALPCAKRSSSSTSSARPAGAIAPGRNCARRGETLGPRRPDARDQLTAQELQIAELAARGLSNREIGERLFLSHRTIGSHLYRIFPKLGITSRAQLRDALPAAADS